MKPLEFSNEEAKAWRSQVIHFSLTSGAAPVCGSLSNRIEI